MANGKNQGLPVRCRAAVVVVRCCWLYTAAVLGLCVLLHTAADRWWPATLLMYVPSWLWSLPLAILVPAAAMLRPRMLGLLIVALLLVVFPIMGFCIPWPSLLEEAPPSPHLRILTCNVEGGETGKGDALRELIAEIRPDIVALQEALHLNKMAVFPESKWHVIEGPNCLASRYPIRNVEVIDERELKGRGFVIHCDLETPGGALHFFNNHLESPREGLEEVIHGYWRGIPSVKANTALRWHQSERVSRLALDTAGPVLLAGDFNMLTNSAIYGHCWSPFTNAFSSAGLGFGQTKYSRRSTYRVDHVLAGPGWHFRRCWVGPDIGSDHRPVIADVVWAGSK